MCRTNVDVYNHVHMGGGGWKGERGCYKNTIRIIDNLS